MADQDVDAANKAAAARIKAAVPRYNPRRAGKLLPSTYSAPAPAPAEDGLGAERAMLAQLGGVAGLSRASAADRALRGVGKAPKLAPASAPAASGGSDLVTAMAARLRTLEAAQRKMRDALVAKDQELLKAKRDLRAAREALEAEGKDAAAAQSVADDAALLREQNGQLRGQIAEMETFLNDYGLVWVGAGPDTPALPGATAAAGGAPLDPAGADNGRVVAKLEELSALAGGGKKAVVTVGGAARLADAPKVPLRLYANGFMLWRGPFRPYSLDSSQAFFRDVCDGFFPYELREGHPDGIAFAVTNGVAEAYTGPAVEEGGALSTAPDMPGPGRRLVAPDEPGASGLAAHGGRELALPGGGAPGAGRFAGTGAGGGTAPGAGGGASTLSRDALVHRLPSSVVRNGKVIAVREGVAALLRGSLAADRPDVVVVQTPVALQLAAGQDAPPSSPALAPASVTTLQVKSDSGRQTLLLKFRYGDTLGDVYEHVDRHRTKASEYVLRAAFPPAALTDRSQTLEAAGLVPNATLRITPLPGAAKK